MYEQMSFKVQEGSMLELADKEDDNRKNENLQKYADDDFISGNKAMAMLGISRNSFEKAVANGSIPVTIESGKKKYRVSELNKFMETDGYKDLYNGVVDKRNTLNDLTGKDWLPETKSFFIKKDLVQIIRMRRSRNCIRRLILFRILVI